jgi:hypothetical protein
MSLIVDSPSQLIWLDAEGILHADGKPQSVITLEEAETVVRHIRAAANGIRRPILVDLTGLKSISREARAYFAGPETAEVESAAALIVTSPMSKAIGNFFMGLNKGLMPTRLFTSPVLALEWLRQYLP